MAANANVRRGNVRGNNPQPNVGQLIFGSTTTVKKFKEAIGTDVLEIKQNPHTGKLFMVDDAGQVVGAVANKIEGEKDLFEPVISLVTPPDEEGNPDAEFALLHNKGEGVKTMFIL